MKTCKTCGKIFPDGQMWCPFDETALTAVPPADDVGRVVDGRYRVLATIAQGGMGKVYKVEHVNLGQIFAMKVIRRDLLGGEGIVDKFRQEALATSQIGNAHIVFLTDFGIDPDFGAYFVMEHLNGRSLKEVIRGEAPLPLRRVHHILAQIGDALGAAHAKGIVHRDLKPDNIILVSQGTLIDFVKILDFGIAGLLEKADIHSHSGAVLGSPLYVAPEQILGAPPDPRSDIYSLGVILYHMLTGEPPFIGDSILEVLQKHGLEDPLPLFVTRPDANIPHAINDVVLKALEKHPEQRQENVGELVQTFWKGILQASTPPPRPERAPAPPASAAPATPAPPPEPPAPRPVLPSDELEALYERGEFLAPNGKLCAGRLTIRFRDLDRFRYERTTNLRHGGFFAPLGEDLPILTHLEVTLTHPTTGKSLVVYANVVFVARREKTVTGCGLEVEPDERPRLAEFLEAQRALESTSRVDENGIYENLGAPAGFPLDNVTRTILGRLDGRRTLETLKRDLGREAGHVTDLIPYLVKRGVVRKVESEQGKP
ncbi:MAG: protein kinase [Acidobacteria bacterium]|nr:protein kinase [Acidobacteriota bacterium]